MTYKKKNYLKPFLILLGCCLFVLSFFTYSCTDSTPSIASVQHTLVYDFFDSQVPPQIYFSIFVEPVSDYRRAKEIRVKHSATEFEWVIDNPKINELNNSFYLGYSSLFPQIDEQMPLGTYEITYKDNADRECSSIISISDLLSMKVENIKSFKAQNVLDKTCGKECTVTKLVIYDIDGNELYFGDILETLTTKEQILEQYPLAASSRECRLNSNSTIAILLPRVLLIDEMNENIDTIDTDAINTDKKENEKIIDDTIIQEEN